jgi:hypothetical protein
MPTRARRPQPVIHFHSGGGRRTERLHTDVLHTSERRASPLQGRAVHASAAQGGRGAPRRACMHASACKCMQVHASGAPRRACMHVSACKWSSASCVHAVRSGRWPSSGRAPPAGRPLPPRDGAPRAGSRRRHGAASRRLRAVARWSGLFVEHRHAAPKAAPKAPCRAPAMSGAMSSASPCGAQSGAQSAAPAHAHWRCSSVARSPLEPAPR